MVADSEARLTFASSTPSTLVRKRVIRLTHEAQVIPSTGNETLSMWMEGVVMRFSVYSLGVSLHLSSHGSTRNEGRLSRRSGSHRSRPWDAVTMVICPPYIPIAHE